MEFSLNAAVQEVASGSSYHLNIHLESWVSLSLSVAVDMQ
jgi:hypothetical protein